MDLQHGQAFTKRVTIQASTGEKKYNCKTMIFEHFNCIYINLLSKINVLGKPGTKPKAKSVYDKYNGFFSFFNKLLDIVLAKFLLQIMQ